METVKGFKDYTGKEAEKLEEIRKILVGTFERYGFQPAYTPIIEKEEFVKQGNEQDEAVSDTFKLKDKGERELALRYEFTFQLKRISKNKKLPYKRYQIGPVFRDEPASKSRLRQFTQADIDVVGSTIKEEAEILSMASDVLKKVGIQPTILINSRKLMNEVIKKEGIKESEQVLREIDKYGKISEKQVVDNLKKYGADGLIPKFKQGAKFFNKFKAYKDIEELSKYCKIYGIEVMFSPTVVRGLSYYNGNVFEIKGKGIKETLVGGGSYKIGDNQCTGISFGIERLASISKFKQEKEKNLVVSLNKDEDAINLAKKMRKHGRVVSIYYGKPSKALEYANAYGFTYVVFVGKEETKTGEYKIKNLNTGSQSRLEF